MSLFQKDEFLRLSQIPLGNGDKKYTPLDRATPSNVTE